MTNVDVVSTLQCETSHRPQSLVSYKHVKGGIITLKTVKT